MSKLKNNHPKSKQPDTIKKVIRLRQEEIQIYLKPEEPTVRYLKIQSLKITDMNFLSAAK